MCVCAYKIIYIYIYIYTHIYYIYITPADSKERFRSHPMHSYTHTNTHTHTHTPADSKERFRPHPMRPCSRAADKKSSTHSEKSAQSDFTEQIHLGTDFSECAPSATAEPRGSLASCHLYQQLYQDHQPTNYYIRTISPRTIISGSSAHQPKGLLVYSKNQTQKQTQKQKSSGKDERPSTQHARMCFV